MKHAFRVSHAREIRYLATTRLRTCTFLRLLVMPDLPKCTAVFMFSEDNAGDAIRGKVVGFGRWGVCGSPSRIAATVDATEIARLLKYNERWLRSEDAVVVFEVNESELTMTFTLRSGCFTATLVLPLMFGNNVPDMLYYDLPVQDMIFKKGELETQDLDEVSFPYLRHVGIPMRMHRILDTDALHMRYWVWKAGHAFGFCYWNHPSSWISTAPHRQYFIRKFEFIDSIEQSIKAFNFNCLPWRTRERLMLAYAELDRDFYKSYFAFFHRLLRCAGVDVEHTTTKLYRQKKDPISVRYFTDDFFISKEDMMLETLLRLEVYDCKLPNGGVCTVRNKRLYISKE